MVPTLSTSMIYPYKYEAQYTLTKANSRTPNTYGYYCSMKEIPQRSKGESYDYPWQAFGQNDYVLRYTDVMLMRAEALIESGDYNGEALQIINTIREPSVSVPRETSATHHLSSMPKTSARSVSTATSPLRRMPARHCAGSAVWSWPWRVTASSTCAAGAC